MWGYPRAGKREGKTDDSKDIARDERMVVRKVRCSVCWLDAVMVGMKDDSLVVWMVCLMVVL